MSDIEMFCFMGIVILAIMGIFGADGMFLIGATCVLIVLSIIDIIKNERRKLK